MSRSAVTSRTATTMAMAKAGLYSPTMKKDVGHEHHADGADHGGEQHRVVLHPHQGKRIERGRQGEQADRQQACKQMQVGDAEEDGGHDRRLADDHGVEARGVEVEEPLAAAIWTRKAEPSTKRPRLSQLCHSASAQIRPIVVR